MVEGDNDMSSNFQDENWAEASAGMKPKEKMSNPFLIKEQTECPACGNDTGNFLLGNEEVKKHRVCGKCSKTYVIQ